MSDIHARLNSHNLTLDDFKRIASESQDKAEIRIRKSDGTLSNTPLGFISRNIGFSHSQSNNEVTLAFWSALITNDKYASVSNNLRRTLTTMVKNGAALTPSKINEAIKLADNLLNAHNKAKAVTEKAVENALKNKVITQSQVESFKKFSQDFAFKHISAKNDFVEIDMDGNSVDDFVDNEKTFLKRVLNDFYSSRDPDYFSQGNAFGLDVSEFRNPTDAKNVNDFLRNLFPDLTGEHGRQRVIEFINGASFATGNEELPKGSKSINDLFKRAANVNDPACMSALKIMPKEELDKLSACLLKKGNDPARTREDLSKMLVAVNNFFKANSEFKDSMYFFGKKLSHAMDALIKYYEKSSVPTSSSLYALSQELAIDSFIEDIEDVTFGLPLCRKLGLEPYAVKALLLQPENRKAIIEGYKNVEGDFYSHIKEKLSDLAQKNALFLRRFSNLDMYSDKIPSACVVGTYIDRVIKELLKKEPDVPTILENIKDAEKSIERFFVSGKETSAVLKEVMKLLDISLSINDRNKLQSKQNQTYILTLYQDLIEIKKNGADLTLKDKKDLEKIDELLLALLNILTADLDEDSRVDPASVKASGNNIELKESLLDNIPGSKKIKRNASDVEIYSAQQAILNSPELNDDKKKTAISLIKLTKCTDIAFIKGFVDVNDNLATILDVFKSNSQQKINSIVLQLLEFGNKLLNTETLLAGYSKEDVADFYFDAIIALCDQKSLENLNGGLRDKYTKAVLEIINTLQAKEKQADPSALDIASHVKFSYTEAVDVLLNNINKLGEKVAAKLNLQNPQPLFDPDAKRYPGEIPYQDNLPDAFAKLFRLTFKPFDKVMVGFNELSQEKKDAVKDFIYKLKVPVSDKEPLKNAGAYGENKIFDYSYINENGEAVDGYWRLEDMMCLVGQKAKELSELLDQSGGNPTPQQVWGVLHGGQAPADLNFDNLLNKLAIQLNEEIDALGKLLGKKNFEPLMVYGSLNLIGINITDYIKKLSTADKEDVVFELSEQNGGHGVFPIDCINGYQFKDGSSDFGFGLDFPRAINPQGVTSVEGCKITLQTGNNKEKIFTEKESWNTGDLNGNKKYTSNMAKEIRESLGNISDQQLCGVGFCITQGIQAILHEAPVLYYNVAEGAEHTALDHTIRKLDNGKIQVTVNEKPGTAFFKFHMVLEVDVNGMINCKEGKISFASLEKIQNYKKEHPEVAI